MTNFRRVGLSSFKPISQLRKRSHLTRWLRSSVPMTQERPLIPELSFLGATDNHVDLCRKLEKVGVDASAIKHQARHVSLCYLRLAEQHLVEAEVAYEMGLDRAVYSRSYYAAYSASKAVRYRVSGFVSLKGDDHKKAGLELPRDFPDLDSWSFEISQLREHRSRADYDNWYDSPKENMMTTGQVLAKARAFIKVATIYLHSRYGAGL